MKKFLLTLMACFVCLWAYADGVVYFTNPNGWANPYVWIWNKNTNVNYTGGSWPGKAMTKVNDNLWSYNWTGSGTPTNVIFNNGNTNSMVQPSDLTY